MSDDSSKETHLTAEWGTSVSPNSQTRLGMDDGLSMTMSLLFLGACPQDLSTTPQGLGSSLDHWPALGCILSVFYEIFS